MSGQRKSLRKRKAKNNILPGEPSDQSESTIRVRETINVDGVDNMGISNNDMFVPTLTGQGNSAVERELDILKGSLETMATKMANLDAMASKMSDLENILGNCCHKKDSRLMETLKQ